jgi:hypothetical protein
MIMGFFMLLAQVLNALLRGYPSSPMMPWVCSCSAAISANCHRRSADEIVHLEPVQWGVIGKDDQGNQVCSFASRDVHPPDIGSLVLSLQPRDAGAEVWEGLSLPRMILLLITNPKALISAWRTISR